jgi:uncharacterized protein (TIGR00299 family) protein
MILGALLDAGLNIEELREDLSLLGLSGYEIRAEKTSRRHLSATSFFVDVEGQQHSDRRLPQILDLLDSSRLSTSIRETAKSIFLKLAETEAEIHSTTPEKIHFPEVGAVDAIVDVVGALIGLERLGIDEVYASAINVGGGFVECKHGVLPVPAPAAMKLLEGVPIYSRGPQVELATPTGSVLLKTLAKSFGPLPPQKILSHGYGAGKSDFEDWPNLLRVVVGEPTDAYVGDEVVVLSTNVDDMNPENFEYLMDLLLEEGALDVYLTSIQAKKTRPGTLLTLLCLPGDASAMASILFSESTTFGVRYHREARLKLSREILEVTTSWGQVKVKVGSAGGDLQTVSPEFEDCKNIARANGVPLRRVYDAARNAAIQKLEEQI